MFDASYIVLCAVGAALCMLPLPWHWQARNVSTLIYLGWTSTACLIACINAIIWAGNVDDKAPVWCDISSRYFVCLNAGITAAGLCLQRRLYRVATIKETSIADDLKGRELVINLLLGIGLPLLTLPLHYVVQSSRYVIVEDVGCVADSFASFVYAGTSSSPGHMIKILTDISKGFTIRAFFKLRREFSQVLSDSGSGISLSRFFRLMALAATDMFCALPMALYFFIDNLMGEGANVYSWADIHKYVDEVTVITKEDIKSDPNFAIGLGFNRWSIPACSFVFFMYFGLSSEAIKHYKSIFWRAVAPFGFKPHPPRPRNQTFSW
ncbi:STE3-type pheromone receptor [Ceratobasidium sp. AG-Ba]|nr:STE3-type pheromone receptor [Ceratobasidium sp. AG-Ba]QRW06830.1 STE3-type pheromone receptor [Ceratobasidium sp. AG-Ba]